MKIRRVSSDFTIATQLTPDKVAKVARSGYRSLICNRPDNESNDQPAFSAIEASAAAAGLKSAYIPISLDGATDHDKSLFRKALNEMPKPIFAYCRSGLRCYNLWCDVMRLE